MTACPAPNAYTLALPRRMQCTNSLKPFFERTVLDPARGPVSDAGQEGDHEAEQLLNRTEKRGVRVTRHLVLWRCHTSADNEWPRAEELVHYPEKVAEYDSASRRPHAAGPPAVMKRAPLRFHCPAALGPEPGWLCHLR